MDTGRSCHQTHRRPGSTGYRCTCCRSQGTARYRWPCNSNRPAHRRPKRQAMAAPHSTWNQTCTLSDTPAIRCHCTPRHLPRWLVLVRQDLGREKWLQSRTSAEGFHFRLRSGTTTSRTVLHGSIPGGCSSGSSHNSRRSWRRQQATTSSSKNCRCRRRRHGRNRASGQHHCIRSPGNLPRHWDTCRSDRKFAPRRGSTGRHYTRHRNCRQLETCVSGALWRATAPRSLRRPMPGKCRFHHCRARLVQQPQERGWQ